MANKTTKKYKSKSSCCEFCSRKFQSLQASVTHGRFCRKNPDYAKNERRRTTMRRRTMEEKKLAVANMSEDKRQMISEAMGTLPPDPTNGDVYIKFCPCCGFSMDRITITG